MKTFFLVIAIFIFRLNGFSQQDPLNSMYLFDKMLINPAFTGSSDWVVGTIKAREQYTGLEGNPSTQTFNFHAPLNRRKMGIGIKIVNDEIAITKTINAALLYSYHLNFGRGKLSFGIETGIIKREINFSKLILNQQNDNVFPLLTESATVPDISWGLYYQKKQAYVGFSQYHTLKNTFNDSEKSNSKLSSHFNFLAGNIFKINKKWDIETSTLVKIVSGAPLQADVNTILYYNKLIGVGAQYRTEDAVVLFMKISILENLKLAYAYEIITSDLSNSATGSHEVLISYGIKLAPPPSQKEIHPRFYF